MRARTYAFACAVTVTVFSGCAAGALAASGGPRVARFDATLTGDAVTHWSVPYQMLSSSCYHDLYQQGKGENEDEVRMPARKLVVFGYPHSTPSLTLGSWQLFHPAKAFGHELLDRSGSGTTYDKPGNCGAGGGGPTTTTGPYDCGTRSGDPQISISNLSRGDIGINVADVKAEIRPYTNCPVFYASDSAASGFSSVFTRLPARDLFNSRKRRLVLRARHHWHHGSSGATTNYYIADTTVSWTLTLTRH
jgi:hypothetical protein